MNKFILCLFLTVQMVFGQNVRQGVPVETTTRTEVIIIEENNDYSVSFCPMYLSTSFLTSGIIRSEYTSSKFKRSFKMIKHQFPAISAEAFDYECAKEAAIVDYKKIDSEFIVVSKLTKKKVEHYYVDVIDLNTMQKTINQKEVIRFKTNENNVCFYIGKKGNHYELLLKRVSGNINEEYFQYFLLSPAFKVVKYQKILIDKLLRNGKLSMIQNIENVTKLIMTNEIVNKETKEVRSIYGVFDIEADTCKFSKFYGPKHLFISDTKVLGKENNHLLLSVMKSSTTGFIDKIGVVDLKLARINILNIPEQIKDVFKKMNLLYISNYNQIKVKKISDYVFAAESYQDFYSLNSTTTQRIFGPVLLFRVSSEGNQIVWAKIFSKEEVFEKELKSEPLWVDLDDTIQLLGNIGKKGLTIFSINKSSGQILHDKTIEISESEKTYLDNKRTASNKNASFFYCSDKKSLRPGAERFSSERDVTPILIHF